MSVGAVHHEDYLVGRAFKGFTLRAADAPELFHEVCLRGKASCGVRNHHVKPAGLAGTHSVKDNGRGIAPGLAHDVNAVALAPDRKLLARGGPKRIGSGQKHGLIVGGKPLGNLADCGGFTGTVNARHHHHEGLGAVYVKRLLRGQEDALNFIAQRKAHFFRGFKAPEFYRVAQPL